jgi:hypothetical protein
MDDLLQRTAIAVNRRGLLKRGTALTFGLFAGLAAGRVEVALADGCTGPFGSGPCAAVNCNGCNCRSGGGVSCQFVSGYCPPYSGNSCWGSGSHVCCDCQCASGSFGWYCYCHGC